MDDKIRYTGVLRLPREYCVLDDKFAELTDFLKTYGETVREVMFFNGVAHSVQKLSVSEEFAAAFRRRYPILKELGVRAGINAHATVGFFEQGGDLICRDVPFMRNPDGKVNVGALCMTDERALEYIDKQYAVLAAARPDFLYVDDDMKLHLNSTCTCDTCLGKFERLTGAFGKAGLPVSGESFTELCDDEAFAEKWFAFAAEANAEIYRRAERAVHRERPDAELGYMTCCGPLLKSEHEKYAAALDGGAGEVRVRPGGGLYTDRQPLELLDKLASMGAQILNLSDSVRKIEGELENWPSQSTRKSRRFTELESLGYLAIGCTGVAFNMLAYMTPLGEYADRWDMMRSLSAFGEGYVGAFGKNPPRGVNVLSGFTDGDRVTAKRHYLHEHVEQLETAGIPFCFDTSAARAFVITKKAAETLDDASLKRALSRAAFIGGDALEALNARGLADYTGFTVEAVWEKDTIERDLPVSFNAYPDGGVLCGRDGNQAFFWFPEYAKAYAVKAACDGATYLTEMYDFAGNRRGYAMAAGVNRYGGKICVSGYFPYTFCESYACKYRLRSVFDWLTDGEMPTVRSNHKIVLYHRDTTDGGNGVTLLNMSLDDACDVRVRLPHCTADVVPVRIYDGDRMIETELRRTGEEYALDRLPALRAGYFIVG